MSTARCTIQDAFKVAKVWKMFRKHAQT